MSPRIGSLVVAASICVIAGCVVPSPPPPMSAARLVHPPGDRGRLGFSAGIAATVDDEEQTAIYAFPSEAGLGLTLGDRYDFGLSFGNLMGSLEGNVILIDSSFKLGLVHGGGFALLASREAGTLLAQGSGGLLFQTSHHRPFYVSTKYTFSSAVGETDAWLPTHYATTTFGFMPSGRPRFVPEVAVNYATNEDGWNATVIVGVTILSDF